MGLLAVVWVHVYLLVCTAGGAAIGLREPWVGRTWGYFAARNTATVARGFPGRVSDKAWWRHELVYGVGLPFLQGAVPPWGLPARGASRAYASAHWAVVISEARFFSPFLRVLTWLVWALEAEGGILAFAGGATLCLALTFGLFRRTRGWARAMLRALVASVVLSLVAWAAAFGVERAGMQLTPRGWL